MPLPRFWRGALQVLPGTTASVTAAIDPLARVLRDFVRDTIGSIGPVTAEVGKGREPGQRTKAISTSGSSSLSCLSACSRSGPCQPERWCQCPNPPSWHTVCLLASKAPLSLRLSRQSSSSFEAPVQAQDASAVRYVDEGHKVHVHFAHVASLGAQRPSDAVEQPLCQGAAAIRSGPTPQHAV